MEDVDPVQSEGSEDIHMKKAVKKAVKKVVAVLAACARACWSRSRMT